MTFREEVARAIHQSAWPHDAADAAIAIFIERLRRLSEEYGGGMDSLYALDKLADQLESELKT